MKDLWIRELGERTRGACSCKSCKRVWGPLKKRGRHRARQRLKARLRRSSE